MGAHHESELRPLAYASRQASKHSLGLRVTRTLLALEHRILFDGAGASVVAGVLDLKEVAPNLPPEITRPASATGNEDSPLAFDLPSVLPTGSAAPIGHASHIILSDPDAHGGSYTLSLDVANGRLNLTSNAALTIQGNDSANLRVSGDLSDINAA